MPKIRKRDKYQIIKHISQKQGVSLEEASEIYAKTSQKERARLLKKIGENGSL